MNVFLFAVFVNYVVSELDWELYKHELYDVTSSTDWIGTNSDSTLSSLTLVNPTICVPKSSMYLAGGKNKIQRSIQMPTNRKFAAIQISLDIYFLNQWIDSKLLFYLNNYIVQDYTPTQSTIVGNIEYCTLTAPLVRVADDSVLQVQYTQDFTESQINIEIIIVGLPITRIFTLQNFYLSVYYCDINCSVCNTEGKCKICNDGLTLDANHECICETVGQYPYYIFYKGNGEFTCVFPCPNGYVPDNNHVCQQGTLNPIFSDLTGSFSSYLFYIDKDKYYSDQNNNDYRIITIESDVAAGPIRFNEKVIYEPLSISVNSQILIKFRLYVLRYEQSQQVSSNVNLKINGYEVLQIKDFDNVYLFDPIGSTMSGNRRDCIFNNYDKCFITDIEFVYNANYEITQILFESHFPLSEPNRAWAISNFEIQKLTITGQVNQCQNNCLTCQYQQPTLCISCVTGYYLFDTLCLQNCPSQTTLVGNVCKEDNIIENVQYLLNALYDETDFQREIAAIDTVQASPQNMTFTKFMYGSQIYSLLGGFKAWNYETLYYQIQSSQPFYKAYLKFNAFCFDCKSASQLSIQDTQTTPFTYKICLTGVCNSHFSNIGDLYGQQGVDRKEYIASAFIQFPLTSSVSSFTMKFMKLNTDSYEYLGIYNLRFLVVSCPQFCTVCDTSGTCSTWISDVSLTPGTGNCASNYYYDTQEYECKVCGVGCANCNSLIECNTCDIGYTLKYGACYCNGNLQRFQTCVVTANCQIGCTICGLSSQLLKISVILQNPYQQCSKCDDTLHYWLDIDTCRCLDGYYMDQITCLPCSKYCKSCQKQPKVCTSCNSNLYRILHFQQCECMDGYYEQENTVQCSKCDIVCYTCRFFANYCTSCYPEQFRTIINRNCECMDGYFDEGVSICKKCDSKCKACLDLETCISCYPYQNRKLSLISNKCICKLGYFEVENQLNCDSCHFSCKDCLQSSLINMCTRCPSTRLPSKSDTIFSCVCKRGYYESNMNECSDCRNYSNPPSTHYCYSNCGDKIIQWNEDCDDGNNEPKDGCYLCLFPGSYCFNQLCTKCEMGICVECVDGYFLNTENQCEQCDQSCKTCITKYDNCTSCVLYNDDKTKCVMCQTDKGFQIKDNQCVSICGDGLKVDKEKCDDGNDKFGDGCYKCEVEDGWICDTVCERIIYPIISFSEDKFDNQYDSIRNIIAQTSIKLSLKGSIDDLCVFNMKNAEIFQILKQDDISNYSESYVILKLSLQIQLENKSLNPILICNIKNSSSFISEQGFTFQNTSFEFQLLEFNKQSQGVVQATQGLMSFSKYILYILLGLAIFAFLVGGLDIFFNLLDVLQLISYLQFFNIIYPYNVDSYFQLFDFAQFDFIKNIFDVEALINQHVESPQPDYKFADQGYSSTFYINGMAVFTVFLTTIGIFLGCRYGFLFIAKLLEYYSDDEDTSLEEEPNVLKYILFRILRNVQKMFLNILGEFSSGIIRTFMAVAYDYNLAVFLQIRAYNTDSKLLKSSFVFSIIFLLIEIYFLFEGFKIMSNKPYYLQSFYVKRQYGALYEGVHIRSSNPYSNYYNLVLLMKKMFFVIFLVLLYFEACFQIFICSALNIIFIVYIYYNKPFEEQYEFYKTLGSEIFIWIAEILIIILFYGQQNGFDYDQELIVGWFIIACCTLLILYQIVIDVKQHFEFLIREYQILSKIFKRLKLLINGGRMPAETEENLVEVVNSGKQSKKISKSTLKTKSTTATSLHKQRKLVTFTIQG